MNVWYVYAWKMRRMNQTVRDGKKENGWAKKGNVVKKKSFVAQQEGEQPYSPSYIFLPRITGDPNSVDPIAVAPLDLQFGRFWFVGGSA